MIESYNTSDLCYAGDARNFHVKGKFPFKTLCHRAERSQIKEVGEVAIIQITDMQFCPSCTAIVESWNRLDQTIDKMRKRIARKAKVGE